MHVQPAILEQDLTEIQNKINLVKNVCSEIHLDVMDGDFVPNTTFNDPLALSELDWGNLKVSLHLMISNPTLYLRKWAFDQVETMIIHSETCTNLAEAANVIHQLGKKVGVALNPHTPTYDVKDFLNEIDSVLIMAVEPGFSAQAFNADVLTKIHYLRELKSDLVIGVDGGVNDKTAALIRKAGASMVCSNSYLFHHQNLAQAIKSLE